MKKNKIQHRINSNVKIKNKKVQKKIYSKCDFHKQIVKKI
jgi:hypothetical protein